MCLRYAGPSEVPFHFKRVTFCLVNLGTALGRPEATVTRSTFSQKQPFDSGYRQLIRGPAGVAAQGNLAP